LVGEVLTGTREDGSLYHLVSKKEKNLVPREVGKVYGHLTHLVVVGRRKRGLRKKIKGNQKKRTRSSLRFSGQQGRSYSISKEKRVT